MLSRREFNRSLALAGIAGIGGLVLPGCEQRVEIAPAKTTDGAREARRRARRDDRHDQEPVEPGAWQLEKAEAGHPLTGLERPIKIMDSNDEDAKQAEFIECLRSGSTPSRSPVPRAK